MNFKQAFGTVAHEIWLAVFWRTYPFWRDAFDPEHRADYDYKWLERQ